ncbi:hypothetical protein NP493_443g02039 [Ridgeia piscesae]|uniref:RING-type domain-containing protein n=1 Tax=Ridgeia piscesae TaxID=27915 RepID=A0AAD9KZU3_RIDPI|nr:hypothetical protein NP493_443g02039 [Ridgeia piscesae]
MDISAMSAWHIPLLSPRQTGPVSPLPRIHVMPSESPTRKRQKLSHGVIDLTQSPSPPPAFHHHWDSMAATENMVRLQPTRRCSTAQQQRRLSVERRSLARAKRSSATRRRNRERHAVHPSESPERRAFQPPPNMSARHMHPAAMLQQHPPLPHHQRQHQHPVVVDIEQMPVSTNPVNVAPYGIPMCTALHHLPMCASAAAAAAAAAHIPLCTTQPTWSFPACAMPVPTCSIQHMPMCSLQQIPMGATPHPLPQMVASHHPVHPQPPHLAPHPHQRQHQHPQPQPQQRPPHHNLTTAAGPHFPTPPIVTRFHVSALQSHEEEVHLIADRRSVYQHIPTVAPPRHVTTPLSLNSSQPMLLQEPTVHAATHELLHPLSRFHRSSGSRSRLMSMAPAPPPYPGFLLHFLAMLGNPPVPPYGMDPNEEAAEVENYEALLNLAERLGEAKPCGLLKTDIDQLPCYRFNADVQRSSLDQTSCVVCMCDFESRQLLRVLPCSHEFHGKCVDKWLKTNRTCPICRADASQKHSHTD